MKSIELMLVVHVMILAAHIAKRRLAHVALVHGLRVLSTQVLAQRLRLREALFADVTPIGHCIVHGSAAVQTRGVLVQLLMLLQLEALVEGLAAHLADGTDLPGVLPHVVEQVLLLAEHVAAGVAFVLHATRVDGHVFLEAVEAGKFPRANGAPEEAAVVLLCVAGVVDFGNVVCKIRKILFGFSLFIKKPTFMFVKLKYCI
jgi:hypothetical protein